MLRRIISNRVKVVSSLIVVGVVAITLAAQERMQHDEPASPQVAPGISVKDSREGAPQGGDGDGGIAGFGNVCGSFNNPSCFVAHTTPGCNDFACCINVCNQDPFCCEVEWDNFCVGTANIACATCGGDGAGQCTNPHTHPACADEGCCNLVCAQDPFCCQTQWDQICANAAVQMCTCGGLGTGDCFSEHGNPWCNDATCCDIVCAIEPYCCDEPWDELCVMHANERCVCGGVQTETCFKTHFFPFCERPECCAEVCAADPFCCDVEWDNFCVGGAYTACCPADMIPWPYGNAQVNVDDLLAVINQWGPCDTFYCISDVSPNGGNGVTNVDDLLFVINRWGACD
jgi:hypothetical protein